MHGIDLFVNSSSMLCYVRALSTRLWL